MATKFSNMVKVQDSLHDDVVMEFMKEQFERLERKLAASEAVGIPVLSFPTIEVGLNGDDLIRDQRSIRWSYKIPEGLEYQHIFCDGSSSRNIQDALNFARQRVYSFINNSVYDALDESTY